MANKKDYICAVPFSSIEQMEHRSYLCCASWLKKYLPMNVKIDEAWNSDDANDIRDSILDGSYRYCDSQQCPMLHQLETFGDLGGSSQRTDVGKIAPLFHKNNLPDGLQKTINDYKNGLPITPSIIQFSFDRTCNLECPSCRVKLFTADKKKIKEVEATIADIELKYGETVQSLYITGSGDPFISVGFRNFLRKFDKSKWPELKSIHLHTNATKWNKKMWDSMKNIHPYVFSCEISIDACTKDTYETKTRLGGNWDDLMDNLKFIETIPKLVKIKPSFVVQQSNYKEIKLFYDTMIGIFGKKANVFFGKITNWGTFSKKEFEKENIWNESHPEHSQFLIELNKTLPARQAWSNLQEFIKPQNSII